MWKITVAAFVITGGILIVWVFLKKNLPRAFLDVGLTAGIGILLLAVVPLIGVLNARVYKVKVWVDSSVHSDRRNNFWPPQATGFNSAMGLLFPALLVPIMATAIAAFPWGIWWLLACVFGEGFTSGG